MALVEDTVPDRDFYILVAGAALLAVCGIFLDSMPVLIASMIVAPLAPPILALSLGVIAGDGRLAGRSAGMLAISIFAAVALAAGLTKISGHLAVDPVFISFSAHIVLDIVIAVISGALAAYGFMQTKVGGVFMGLGVAVSLMPPLVATGIGLVSQDLIVWPVAALIFGLNIAGILAGSVIIFGMFGFGSEYKSLKRSRSFKI